MKTDPNHKKKRLNVMIIGLNIILVLALVSAFLNYDNTYKQNLYAQNLDDIQNINQASANIAASFFDGREIKLRDIAQYTAKKRLTLVQVEDYLYAANTDESKVFELIGPEYKGNCIAKQEQGEFIPVDYSSGYGSMVNIFKAPASETDGSLVHFAPEFTDAYSAMTSFALYNQIDVWTDAGTCTPYTLMVVAQSKDFINLINIKSNYDELNTAIIDESGNYIIGNTVFKSTNFFKFLAVFNDLTLDEQNAVRAEMNDAKKGSLAFKDASGHDSVFVYTPVEGKSWYCISTVPVEQFHNSGTEFSLTITTTAILVILLIMNTVYFLWLSRRLRTSAEREKVASIAKTTFLSQMSHEIRTPMNAIIGMSKLAEDTPMSDEAHHYLEKIENSSQYLLDVLNDILDMSRIESGRFELHPQWTSGNQMFTTCMDVLIPGMERKNIQFNGLPEDMDYNIELFVDPLRMKQILMNLLNNAIKFTPEDGTISLASSVQILDASHRVDTISISDTGCGMSKEFLQRIFTPFEQEQNPYSGIVQGTGLGLALVKQIITAMGGDIEVSSKLGEGSTFTYRLPVEYRVVEKANEQNGSAAMQNIDGARVLLVEDHPLNREIAVKLLEKKGVAVEQAADGEKGVQAFKNSPTGYYNAIFMDIRMPVMNGLQATEAIRSLPREDAKTVPIIAMTANAFDDDAQETRRAGMNAHLAKPIDPQMLYETLSKFLAKDHSAN